MREHLFSITKKDFDITWFSGTGAGGQYRNKHQNCCRMKHIESGVTSTGQSNRNQVSNQKEAFNNIVNSPKFKIWLNTKIYELSEQKKADEIEINKKVDEAMKEDNLLVEYL